MDVKEVGNDMTKFLAGLLGVAAGQLAMSFIPQTKIEIADKLLPGAVGLAGATLLALKTKNPHLKAGAFGLGIAGAANVVNKFTAGKSGILAKINQATALPTASLNGFGFGNPGAMSVMGVEQSLLGVEDSQLQLVA